VFGARSYRNALLSFGKKKVSKENLTALTTFAREYFPASKASGVRFPFAYSYFLAKRKVSRSRELYPGLSCVSPTGNAVETPSAGVFEEGDAARFTKAPVFFK